MLLWLPSSLLLSLLWNIGAGIRDALSKPLYTFSYMLLNNRSVWFSPNSNILTIDVKCLGKPFRLLQWMGMNALVVYMLAACELFPAAIQGFYWRSPENNLVNMTESLLQTIFHSERWGTLAFVLLEILFWCVVAGFLHKKGIYLKL
ncbi:uncharacterized protein A4U43_C02F21680 [Asparagus officinalis]|uniref:Uncharacterized protein n=1 Tax=Asparagus officinalis TaxID=4686 RepID=A0A5P1FK18_ASPOF|nr:uncharacterized protein A4U43_C02F21680 [Asparagus officinalis]